MSQVTFLTRVVIENYKSIAACDVRLGPLMFLVGPNGAGKSNFLDALCFVRDALSNSLDFALRSRGGGADICHVPSRSGRSFRIRLEFDISDSRRGVYEIKIGAAGNGTKQGPWGVLDEQIEIYEPKTAARPSPVLHRRSGHRPPERKPAWISDRLVLASIVDQPAFQPAYEALSRMQFYQIQPRSILDFQPYEPGKALQADGSNLASVLFQLRFTDAVVEERIDEFLRIVLPGLVKARVEPVFEERPELHLDRQRVALLFQQKVGNENVGLFSPSQMSDGTLRALAILVALLQATAETGPRLPLVAIEEPEAQVHPAALGVLLDAMIAASYSTQVLITTQSSDLLDSKEIKTDSILAVSAEDGQTRLGPVDEVSRSMVRKRLYTVGALLRSGSVFPETSSSPASPPCELVPAEERP